MTGNEREPLVPVMPVHGLGIRKKMSFWANTTLGKNVSVPPSAWESFASITFQFSDGHAHLNSSTLVIKVKRKFKKLVEIR